MLRIMGPGEIFGEMALLEGDGSRSATVRSIDAGSTAAIDRKAFDDARLGMTFRTGPTPERAVMRHHGGARSGHHSHPAIASRRLRHPALDLGRQGSTKRRSVARSPVHPRRNTGPASLGGACRPLRRGRSAPDDPASPGRPRLPCRDVSSHGQSRPPRRGERRAVALLPKAQGFRFFGRAVRQEGKHRGCRAIGHRVGWGDRPWLQERLRRSRQVVRRAEPQRTTRAGDRQARRAGRLSRHRSVAS